MAFEIFNHRKGAIEIFQSPKPKLLNFFNQHTLSHPQGSWKNLVSHPYENQKFSIAI
jgi:hypothetical protein